MILERFWCAVKSAGWGWCLGFLVFFAYALLLKNVDWIVLCIPFLTGIIGFVYGFSTGGKTPDHLRARALRMLQRECSRSRHGLEIVESKVLRVGRDVTLAERFDQTINAQFGGGKARVDYLQTVHFRAPQGEFHLIIPWSGPNMLPHEFFSWIQGRLPSPLCLKRGVLGSWSNGCWVGPDGEGGHPLARAAMECDFDMSSGIEWNWEKGNHRIELQWGVQAIPIRKDWYIHIMQTALHEGFVRKSFGLDWYVPRWIAFFLFVNDLKLDGKQEKQFLFQPRSVFVFFRELGMSEEDLMPLEARVRRPAKIDDFLGPIG